MRPPSSYGSMKTDSDSDVMEEVEVEVEEAGGEEEPAVRPQSAPEETRYT